MINDIRHLILDKIFKNILQMLEFLKKKIAIMNFEPTIVVFFKLN